MTILEDIRADLSSATNRNTADVQISGKVEIPKVKGSIVVRFNTDAYVEFPANALVRNSITAFSRKELRKITKRTKEKALGLDDWFHLKIKFGTLCTLHYKALEVNLILDPSLQKPFHIDTKELKCIYLKQPLAKKDSNEKQISCDEFSEDRTNKEVIIYYRHACCCNDNDVEAYGYVNCDNGWRSTDCL